jgi:penicillin amidase
MKRSIPLCALLLSASLLCPAPRSAKVRAQAAPAAAATQAHALSLAGLRAPVKITRDERGIPHIEAANDDDLYFAQGYATAQDRLWQMDLLRRTTRGELSEIFGRAALEADKLHRTYGFAQLSESLVAKATPRSRAVLEAYARGVNAYADSLDGTAGKQLPREFQLLQYKPRPWRAADSVVIGKNFAEALSTTWQTDLARAALADLPPERRAELLPDSSPLDVLVVGTDDAGKKPAGAKPAPKDDERKNHARVVPASDESKTTQAARVRAEVLNEAALMFEASREAMERVGLYMDGRAASNNWVASGKRTASG